MFKAGDIVVLKSGSEKMTIAYDQSEKNQRMTVYYYDFISKKVVEIALNADALKKAD
jgi:uncharacterized protein YodC (DUF2158 family)